MRTATLRVKSNDALVAVSSAHREARFTVHGAWPDGDAIRLLLETGDLDPNVLGETLAGIESVSEARRRSADGDVARFEVATTRPAPHGASGDSGVVPSFPQTVEDGWIVGEVTATHEQLCTFRDDLEEAGIEYELEQLVAASGRERPLTDRQREAVELAAALGYYDYPRTCTLTEFADALEVDTSVASRLLQRAESRIVADFLR